MNTTLLIRRVTQALWPTLLLLLGMALAQTQTAAGAIQPATQGGLQNFVEFSKVIPSMDTLMQDVFNVMASLDVAGLADLIARYTAGALTITSFAFAWINYSLGKRLSFLGIDGSFNNMVMCAATIILLAVGLPRIMGEAGWALWRLTYTNVEQKVGPEIELMIQDRTSKLAIAAWNFAAAGLAAGVQPFEQGYAFLTAAPGQDSIAADATGQATQTRIAADAKEASDNTKHYGTFWQLGSLLIAGMYISYIGVIFGSALFVIFAATMLPIAFAFIPINPNLIYKSVGGMTSSILVAGVAPGLMLANIAIIFDGPISYMTNIMSTSAASAANNSTALTTMMKQCMGQAQQVASTGNWIQNAGAAVGNAVNNAAAAINPLDGLASKVCVMSASYYTGLYTLGQSLVYLLVGLIVTGMLFVGLSGMAMMIFRAFKEQVDHLFGAGGSVGNGDNGKAMAFAKDIGNRVAGAALAAGGAMTGNPQLAAAGMRSVASGRDAVGGAVAGYSADKRQEGISREKAADKQERKDEKASDKAERLSEKQSDKQERQQETSAREQKQDEKYAQREAAQTSRRESERAEYASNQDKGTGSKTDPAGSKSGGRDASKPDGGAVNSTAQGGSGQGQTSQTQTSSPQTTGAQTSGAQTAGGSVASGAGASRPAAQSSGTPQASAPLSSQPQATAVSAARPASSTTTGPTTAATTPPAPAPAPAPTPAPAQPASEAPAAAESGHGAGEAAGTPTPPASQQETARQSNETLEKELSGAAAVGAASEVGRSSEPTTPDRSGPDEGGPASSAPKSNAQLEQDMTSEAPATEATRGAAPVQGGEVSAGMALEEELTGAPGLEVDREVQEVGGSLQANPRASGETVTPTSTTPASSNADLERDFGGQPAQVTSGQATPAETDGTTATGAIGSPAPQAVNTGTVSSPPATGTGSAALTASEEAAKKAMPGLPDQGARVPQEVPATANGAPLQTGGVSAGMALEEELTGAPALEREREGQTGTVPASSTADLERDLGGQPAQATSVPVSGITNTPAPVQASAAPQAALSTTDAAAVRREYRDLNAQGGPAGEAYSSPEQVRYGLERTGQLPSQIEENDRRVTRSASEQGVSNVQAREALQGQGGLVHQQLPDRPLPPQDRSEAEYRAARPEDTSTEE